MTTDILDYKGQPELAGGFTGDGRAVDGELTGINDMLKNLAQDNTRWNIQQYQQKVKDREDTLDAIAKNQIDFDVDNSYRPTLERQLDKIKNIRLATPDIKSNPKAWGELQSEINKFKEMSTYAKANSLELKKMVQDYANNPDERYRQTLGQHIETQRNKGVLHQVQPYQKLQDWSSELFGDVPEKVVTKTTMPGTSGTGTGGGKEAIQETVTNDPNKSIFSIKTIASKPITKDGIHLNEVTVGSDLTDWDKYYSPSTFLEGENKNLPDQAKVFYNFFSNSPQFMNDGTLSAINSKLDAVNKANNLQPGNPRYLQPIAVKQDNGWQLTQDPLQLVKDVSLYKNYEMPKTQNVVDEKLMKAYVDKSNIAQNYGSADQAHAAASRSRFLNWSDKEKLPLELKKLQSEIDENNRTGNISTTQGLEATKTVMNLIDATNKQHFYKLDDNAKVSSYEKGKFISPSLIRQTAGVSENAEIRIIPLGDPAVQKGMLIPEIENGKAASATKPLRAFMIKDGDNVKFIGLYKGLPGEDKDKMSIQVFEPGNMASNYISAGNNFTSTDKDETAKNTAFNYFEQLGGQQNNATGNAEVKKDNAVLRTKVVNGVTYGFDGNGWYPIR